MDARAQALLIKLRSAPTRQCIRELNDIFLEPQEHYCTLVAKAAADVLLRAPASLDKFLDAVEAEGAEAVQPFRAVLAVSEALAGAVANSGRVGPLIKLCVSGIKQSDNLQVAIPACGLLASITFLQFAPSTNMELAEKAGAIKAIVQLLTSLHQPNTQSDTPQQRQMKQMFGFAIFEGLKTLNNLVARSENRCRSAVQQGSTQLVTALLLPGMEPAARLRGAALMVLHNMLRIVNTSLPPDPVLRQQCLHRLAAILAEGIEEEGATASSQGSSQRPLTVHQAQAATCLAKIQRQHRELAQPMGQALLAAGAPPALAQLMGLDQSSVELLQYEAQHAATLAHHGMAQLAQMLKPACGKPAQQRQVAQQVAAAGCIQLAKDFAMGQRAAHIGADPALHGHYRSAAVQLLVLLAHASVECAEAIGQETLEQLPAVLESSDAQAEEVAAAEEQRKTKCAQCGASEADEGVKLLRCSRCQLAVYCGKECQKKHWKKGHSKVCGGGLMLL